MKIGEQFARILDYKITFNPQARINIAHAVAIVVAFMVLLGTVGNVIGDRLFWNDQRDVFTKKVEAIAKATSEKTNNSENQSEVAFAYYLKGNMAQARRVFEEILSTDKDNSAANIYYGLILAEQKEYKEAILHLEPGIKQEPGREKLAYFYLGLSYYNVGEPDKALNYLKSGGKLDPSSPLNQYYLGLAYKQKGQYKEAKAAFIESLRLSGNRYPEASEELEKLSK